MDGREVQIKNKKKKKGKEKEKKKENEFTPDDQSLMSSERHRLNEEERKSLGDHFFFFLCVNNAIKCQT